MSTGRWRRLALSGAVATLVAGLLAPAPASARPPLVRFSGTVAGQTTSPDVVRALPGSTSVAALTECASETRVIPGFGSGALIAVDANGEYSGELVSGCHYDVYVVTNPCGTQATTPQADVDPRRSPIRQRYVIPITAPPAPQPDEPEGDPSPGYTIEVVDATRTLDVWPCRYSPDRTIRATVMIPEGDGPFPLVVVGHGLGGTRFAVQETAVGYRSRGYVVVAPTFPMVSPTQPMVETVPDLPNQPGDVSAVLDEVLRTSQVEGDLLYGKVDGTRIGYEGVSGGAITGLLLLNECCADARVDALSVSMGYFLPTGFVGGRYRLPRGTSPALFMANNVDDQIIPFDSALAGWEDAEPDKFLAYGTRDDCQVSHCLPVGAHDGAELFMDAYVKDDVSARQALIDLFSTSTGTVTRRHEVVG